MVFGWFSRKPKPTPAPAPAPVSHWASYLTLAQQGRVEQLVQQWFAQRGQRVEVGTGSVRLGEREYGLENLAQRCRPLPSDEWPLVVDDHFAGVLAAEAEQEEWDRRCGDYDWVGPLLRLRLYPPEYLGDGREAWMLHRVDLAATVSVVVADLPRAVMSVKPELLTAWGRSRDEVFALALAQTLRECPVEWERVELGGQPPVCLHAASADHFFVCTQVLDPDAFRHLQADEGVLVAIPDRQTLLAVPLAGANCVAAMQQLLRIAAQRYQQGPGSVAPHAYWCRQGSVVQQPVVVTKDTLDFLPTAELLAALDRLAAQG